MEGWDCCPTDVFLCSAHRGPWDVPEQKATHHTTPFGGWKPRRLSLPRSRSNPIAQKVLRGRSIIYNCILLCITYDLPQMCGLCSFHYTHRGPGGLSVRRMPHRLSNEQGLIGKPFLHNFVKCCLPSGTHTHTHTDTLTLWYYLLFLVLKSS